VSYGSSGRLGPQPLERSKGSVMRSSRAGEALRVRERLGVSRGAEALVLARRDSEEGGAWRSLEDSGGDGIKEVSEGVTESETG